MCNYILVISAIQPARFKKLMFSFAARIHRVSRRQQFTNCFPPAHSVHLAAHIETIEVMYRSFENQNSFSTTSASQGSTFIRDWIWTKAIHPGLKPGLLAFGIQLSNRSKYRNVPNWWDWLSIQHSINYASGFNSARRVHSRVVHLKYEMTYACHTRSSHRL